MKRGFTLIEILVVVLIVGILASIAIPQYQQAVYKARYTKLMPLVKAFKNAEEEYWYMHRRYTYNFADLGFSIKGFESELIQECPGFEPDKKTDCYQLTSADGRYKLSTYYIGVAGGAVFGSLTLKGESVGYLIYLDHRDTFSTSRRFCYSNTNNSGNWRYKLCASLTGSPAPQSGWGGDPRFEFVK